MSVPTAPSRLRLFRLVAAAVFAAALLLSLRPSAEAATYRNHVARVPATPTSAETVRIWINSDTAVGETAGVETRIGGVYNKYLGAFDGGGYPGANWRVDLPAQPHGTFVEYQLFTRNEFGSDYGFTGFNWSYTVDDGDVQWDGLKHDTFDSYYRSPFGAVPAGTTVTLRFRTVPLDVDGVAVRVYTYDPSTNPPSTSGPVDYPMTYQSDMGGYAFWTLNLDTPTSPAILYYHFVVTDGLDVDYYSDDHSGPHDNVNQGGTGAAGDNQGADGFQLTVYDPAFQTPDWLKDAVVYQIFPDRFRNGDPTNDYCRDGSTAGCPVFYGDQDILLREPWNSLIGNPRVPGPYENEYGTQFYGGDLQGLIDKLDYLQAAGFDTIYTTPIFDGSSNHRYDTDDYMAIDPALGTLADFNELIDELDARGMKLIVDGVFNHTSSDSLYFDRYGRYPGNDGACESLTSEYRDWYEFQNNDAPCGTGDYTGWFGYDTLAVLVDGEAEVRDFIYRDANSVMETWYDRGVHGWRFDVADEISHDWWRDFRPYAKADAPNGPLVGEVWPDASAFLLGDQLDSVMNYRFRKNVLGFVRQNGWNDNDNNGNNQIISLTPSQFDRALLSVREDYPPEATLAMLNLLDSHDTNRLRYLVDIVGESDAETLQRQKLAALFQYTYMGAPMVYYGDEVALDSPSLANGVNGPEDDPYNRAPYPWADEAGDDDIYGPADADMLAFYTRLAELRQQYPFLSGGNFEVSLTGDTSTWSTTDNTTYAYARYNQAQDEVVFVLLNPGSTANTATLYSGWLPEGSVWEDMLTGNTYTADYESITVTLPPRSGMFLAKAVTSLTVEKTVDGNTAGLSNWQFSVNGNNAYTLPPAGGDFTITGIITGTTTVAETDVAGWAATVSCDNAATGTASTSFNLDTGEDVTCTFTNTMCLAGSYDDGAACTAAEAGYYVPGDAATAQTACAPGYYQPNEGQTSCLMADAGYYVDTTAATSQTACPAGTTSPPGSDSADDCVSVVTTATLTIAKETNPAGGTGFPFTFGQGEFAFLTAWGYDNIDGQLNHPNDVAVDGAGNVYVADTQNHRIQKFNGDGDYLGQWGSEGSADGQFSYPGGVAVDGAGNVYVADTYNHRIHKFDSEGNYQDKWGSFGSLDGQFTSPSGVAVDGAGNVYVADNGNHRIQVFEGDGDYLDQWGDPGSGNGQLHHPYDVAVDGAGDVYVVDNGNDRIQVFEGDGDYLDQWGGFGNGNGQFFSPTSVALDDLGNVYVADSFNHRIQVFEGDGDYLDQWGSFGSDDGKFYVPYGIALDGTGNVYVADSRNHRIQVFDGDGDYLDQWGSYGQLDYPNDVAVDGAGNVYVADTDNDRIQVFDSDGNFLDRWGSSGSGNGQFADPEGIAVDGAGNVYVADTDNDRIQVFDSDGNYLYQWDGSGGVAGQFAFPKAIAVDGAGNVYVADTGNDRIQVFDSGGNYLYQWGSGGSGNGQFNFPAGIAVDGAGNVYVADAGNRRIQVFEGDGDYLDQWGSSGSGNGQFSYPSGVAVDGAGNVYVADTYNHRIQVFDGDGDYLDQWGSEGNGDGQLNEPYGIAVDWAGNVYVADTNNSRIQKFGKETVTLDDGESHSFTDVAPGTYQVSELVPAGWSLTDITCDGGSPDENGDTVSVTLAAGDDVTCTFTNTELDTTAPTVTINQAAGQADPTSASPINFTVVFSEPVTGFTDADVTLSGTAGATTAVVTGSGTTYNVAVSGMAANGTVIATVGAGVAEDAASNPNAASTSTDNAVTYNGIDVTAPTVTIDQAAGQADPTSASPINFTVVFSEPVTGFTDADVVLSGTAGATTAVVTGSGTTYNVAVSGMTGSGTVIATVPANVAEDAAGNDNTASTSTDNIVTYNAPDTTAPTVTINQAAGQADPTSASPINFTVVFSEPVTGFETGDVTLSGTAGATTAVVTGSGTTYNVAVSGMTGSGTVIATVPANVAEDAAGNDNTASTSTDNTVTYNAPALPGAIYVTAAGGNVAGMGSYQKNDILKWDGNAWSVWFDGASAGMLATSDIMAFDVDDDGDGSAWVVIRQAQKLPGVGKMQPQQIAYYNGDNWTRFFDGRDVGLLTSGERINGLEVLPGSVSPIGTGCQYYLLITTVAGGGVPVGSGNVNFSGEDVLGFCMTQSGTNTQGQWHVVFDGQSEGLPKNNNLGLSASDDGATLHFTPKKNFSGDGGLVRPSELVSWSNGTFSGPLWKAKNHGLMQLVDGIDVVGNVP